MMSSLYSIVSKTIQLHVALSCSLFVIGAPPSSLKLVSVLYRHGDRSPSSIYPKDINQVSNSWPDGLGWLSNTGKQQQYELGQWLNQRYTGFINTSYYNHEEIVIESSSYDRCLMSAYSNLAGLFPPREDQKLNRDIPWQPIPVQTRPKAMDNKLAQMADCPRYYQLYDQVMNSPAVKKYQQENKHFYDMVVEETGVKKDDFTDILSVADTLLCERAHNMTMNDWVKPGFLKKMDHLRNWGFKMLYSSAEMAKIEGGPLLKEIVGNMNNASKLSTPMPKFYMYSAHDSTVAGLLSALDVFDGYQPMYRSLVMVELHHIKEDHIVKIFYRNSTTAEPVQLSPPGCPLDCKLDIFVEAVKGRIPEDWYKTCQVVSSSSSSLHISVRSFMMIGAAAIFRFILKYL